MFEIATRTRMRLQSIRGLLSVEDLWRVPLRSTDGFNLDAIARTAKTALKESTKKSFVDEAAPAPGASIPLDIIKHIIKVKLAEEAARESAAANMLERQKYIRILGAKQDEALEGLSEAELEKRIQALK